MSGELVVKPPQHSFAEIERMAGAVAKSQLFGVKNQDQAIALMLLAQAEGLHPAIAARDYHIIEGKPSLRVDAMVAKFQAAGGKIKIHEMTEQKCDATFSIGGESLKVEWTIEMAQRAGLAHRDVWKKYARPMLRSRCMSEGIRTIAPGVITGIYSVDEMADGVAADEEAVQPSPHFDEDAEILDTSTGEITREQVKEAARAPAAAPLEVASDAQRVPQTEVDLHTSLISTAKDIVQLRRAHSEAYKVAKVLNDVEALKKFEAAKEAAKARITAGET